MNQNQPGLEVFLQKISQAERGTILLTAQPSLDIMAAGLSLYLGLKKAGKDFRIVCSTPVTVGFSHLVGVDKVAQKVNGKSLVVSFEYQEESIDKISYNIKDGRFNLVIQPKPGAEPLPTKNVDYNYEGDPGLLVAMGATQLTDLGDLYNQIKGFFEKGQTVSLKLGSLANFGQPRISFGSISSYSEGVLTVMRKGNLRIDEDIANNLLQGIYHSTKGLSVVGLGAEVFESVAFCVRLGGNWPTQTISNQPLEAKSEGDFQPMPASASAIREPQEIEAKEKTSQESGSEGKQKDPSHPESWVPQFPTQGRNL